MDTGRQSNIGSQSQSSNRGIFQDAAEKAAKLEAKLGPDQSVIIEFKKGGGVFNRNAKVIIKKAPDYSKIKDEAQQQKLKDKVRRRNERALLKLAKYGQPEEKYAEGIRQQIKGLQNKNLTLQDLKELGAKEQELGELQAPTLPPRKSLKERLSVRHYFGAKGYSIPGALWRLPHKLAYKAGLISTPPPHSDYKYKKEPLTQKEAQDGLLAAQAAKHANTHKAGDLTAGDTTLNTVTALPEKANEPLPPSLEDFCKTLPGNIEYEGNGIFRDKLTGFQATLLEDKNTKPPPPQIFLAFSDAGAAPLPPPTEAFKAFVEIYYEGQEVEHFSGEAIDRLRELYANDYKSLPKEYLRDQLRKASNTNREIASKWEQQLKSETTLQATTAKRLGDILGRLDYTIKQDENGNIEGIEKSSKPSSSAEMQKLAKNNQDILQGVNLAIQENLLNDIILEFQNTDKNSDCIYYYENATDNTNEMIFGPIGGALKDLADQHNTLNNDFKELARGNISPMPAWIENNELSPEPFSQASAFSEVQTRKAEKQLKGGNVPKACDQAAAFLKALQTRYPSTTSITATGQGIGGMLAEYAVAHTIANPLPSNDPSHVGGRTGSALGSLPGASPASHLKAVVFNPVPLGPKLQKKIGAKGLQEASEFITSHTLNKPLTKYESWLADHHLTALQPAKIKAFFKLANDKSWNLMGFRTPGNFAKDKFIATREKDESAMATFIRIATAIPRQQNLASPSSNQADNLNRSSSNRGSIPPPPPPEEDDEGEIPPPPPPFSEAEEEAALPDTDTPPPPTEPPPYASSIETPQPHS